MRIVYMDESGTNERQSNLAVCGCIIHGDTQFVPIENHLKSLVEKHIPEDKRECFYFHATDIYHGGGTGCLFNDRQEWPDERRWAILDDLVAIPRKFNIPVCVGWVDKANFRQNLSKEEQVAFQKEGVAIHCIAI